MLKIESFLETLLPKKDIYLNEPMRNYTTFKIGGKADYFIKVDNIKMIKEIIKFTNQNNIPVTVIGNGSNILVTDKGIRGITIKPNFQKIEKEEIKEEFIYKVGSGVPIIALAMQALKDSATGLEFASGIPRNSWWSNSNECGLLWWGNEGCCYEYNIY